MSRLSTRTAWLRVLKNPKCSDAARTKALKSLSPGPGVQLLQKLLADKDCPPRLLVALTEAYAEEMERQSKRPKVGEPEPEPTKSEPKPEPERKRRQLTPEELKELLG